MVKISDEQLRRDAIKIANALGPLPPNPYVDKPDWVRKQVNAIIKAEIKAQGSNKGILTTEHILELIKKVENKS